MTRFPEDPGALAGSSRPQAFAPMAGFQQNIQNCLFQAELADAGELLRPDACILKALVPVRPERIAIQPKRHHGRQREPAQTCAVAVQGTRKAGQSSTYTLTSPGEKRWSPLGSDR